MAFNEKHLGDGEELVLRLRTHWKELIWPTIILILTGAALGAALAFIPLDYRPIGSWIAIALAALIIFVFSVVPWLRWYTSTIAITDRRIITRRGILNRRGHDVPLRRINNVNYERSLTDRMLGCGTLILETAAGQPLTLPDVPKVEHVHVTINDLLYDVHGAPDTADE